MATLYESYNDIADYNSTTVINVSTIWVAQTFTPQTEHSAYSVKLLLYVGTGTATTATVSLRNTTGLEGEEEPIGDDICSKALDISSISTDPDNPDWVEFVFTTNPTLYVDTVYAVCIRRTSGTKNIAVCINYQSE